MEGGWKTPPPPSATTRQKSPVLIGLNGFESERIRDEHYEYCRSKDSVRIEMPMQNPVVKYADGSISLKFHL